MHFVINFTSVQIPFNSWSHFMGTNGMVQAVMQPILILGVVFHLVMDFVFKFNNRNARAISCGSFKGGANSTWVSHNIIYKAIPVIGNGFFCINYPGEI